MRRKRRLKNDSPFALNAVTSRHWGSKRKEQKWFPLPAGSPSEVKEFGDKANKANGLL
jgi:hypothetical protein